jgi:glutamine amidotransferase
MDPAVVLVDAGMGNLRSVENAFGALGHAVEVASSPGALASATHVVMPGVGAFGDGMAALEAGGWVPALEDAVLGRGVPFLGICLGLQLLATWGTEHGDRPGLGWVKGTVERLPESPGIRVPHIGWNDVEATAPCPLVDPSGGTFYFVHSYALAADTPDAVAVTEHGGRFAAVVQRGNVFGVQFHPEKSHRAGLAVLREFAELKPC